MIQTDRTFPSLSDRDWRGFLAGMRTAEYVAIDTESDAKDLRDKTGRVLGLSAAFRLGKAPVFRAYFPIRHYDWNYGNERIAELGEVVKNLDCIIFHNAKHDLVALDTINMSYSGKFYDTMLMAHLVNENSFSKGLDWQAKNILEIPGKDRSKDMDMFIKAFGWGMAPSWMIEEYAAHDTYLTLKLFEHYLPIFSKEITEEEWDFRQKFVRLLIKMEGRGIRIDKNLISQELKVGNKRMDEILEELDLDEDTLGPKALQRILIDELKLPVYETTKTGNISFNKKAMDQYEEVLSKQENETARLVLEYRGWQKTCSSNYEAYLKLVSDDGRVRPNYKLHGTVTGRLSCSDPNLQQIPRVSSKAWNGNLKQAFIPEDGYALYEADYAQLELRLGAAYAEEQELLEAFKDGRDVFTEMSMRLGMSRQDTKTLVYTIQYGGGINRISTVFGVDGARANEIRENFFESYPGFRSVARRASLVARSKGYVKIWTGRRRHFDDPANQNYRAFNSVVQGGAADIVMRAMLRLEDAVDNDNCRMLLQVHDSVVFEIKNDSEDIYLPMIKEVMEDVKDPFDYVKFAVDVHKWGEG